MSETRYEGYKEGFKEGFREGLRTKSENELREELKEELKEEVRQELRDELVDEVKEELREELREECKEGCLKEYLDDFEKGFIEGFEREYPKGIRKGELETLSRLVADGVVSISDAAKCAGTTETELRKELGLPSEASNDATTVETPNEDASEADAPDEDSTFGAWSKVFSDEETDEEDEDEDEEELGYLNMEPVVTRTRMIGIREGRIKMLKQLVIDGVLTLAEAAESGCMTIPEFELEAVWSEERWASEYEPIWRPVGNKVAQPKLEVIVNETIAECRKEGVLEGASIVLDSLVAKNVLTKAAASRYIDDFR